MRYRKHISEALRILGNSYTVKKIDFENCIYKDLNNGIDFEVSYCKEQGYKVWVWDVKNLTVVETSNRIKDMHDLKDALMKLEVKYS